ncbi:aldo/keto reductase [Carnimonas bestiolae]|uniref:aldo/keto reductase n=1 Tax=Carnimonas bestiolae TaxID=3402172 RepID=UPI003EDBF25A
MTVTVNFAGQQLPAIGQGTWRMGDGHYTAEQEVDGLRRGLDLGLTLIDSAEMYGHGRSESIVGRAVKGRRDDAFIVSKALPSNATKKGLKEACERSLSYLGIDCLDLYLLHWPGSTPLSETLEGFEQLIDAGKIKRWGVSNFDTSATNALARTSGSSDCTTNQVLYNLGSRGIEFDLRPRLRELEIPLMAYCPVAQGGSASRHLVNHPIVQEIAAQHNASPTQLLLAWAIRPFNGERDLIAIPKAVTPAHIEENAKALEITLSAEQLKKLDEAFPPPAGPEPLDIV